MARTHAKPPPLRQAASLAPPGMVAGGTSGGQPAAGGEACFQLSKQASFYRLGKRCILFDERSQQVLELDDLTAYMACMLYEPSSPVELASELAERGLDAAGAGECVRQALAALSQAGLLQTDRAPVRSADVHLQAIRICGMAATLAFHDAGLFQRLSSAFIHLERPQSATGRVYDVFGAADWTCIRRQDGSIAIVRPDEAAPTLKSLLTTDILARPGTAPALHASMLVRDRRAMLLCGAPGAGKSTLAVGLLDAGFDMAGDDIVFLHSGGRTTGVPFAATLKPGSWELIESRRLALAAEAVHRRLDGNDVRYLRWVGAVREKPVVVDSLILLRRLEGAQARIDEVEPSRALSEIVGGAFTPTRRLRPGQFSRFADVATRARSVQLTFSDLGQAIAALSRFHDAR